MATAPGGGLPTSARPRPHPRTHLEGQMPHWNRSSFRVHRTVRSGAVAALVCIAFSVLFLLFVGSLKTNTASPGP